MKSLLLCILVMTAFSASAQEPQQNTPEVAAPATDSQAADSENTVSEEDTQGAVLTPIPVPSAANSTAEEITNIESGYKKIALLQGLNKVTARISQIEAPIGETVQFGNLEIAVKRCWQAPPTERPENVALMEIWDRKPGETPKSVFHGWMFSSSPSLAGLEHPVYDVIVLECRSEKESSSKKTD